MKAASAADKTVEIKIKNVKKTAHA